MNDILETPENQTQDYVQQLVAEYNAVGHVPYKEKDKVYQLYHDTLDKIYKELHISVNKRNLDSFMQNLKGIAYLCQQAQLGQLHAKPEKRSGEGR